MKRPQSILGLLFHLVGLYARRIPRRLAVLAALVVAVVAWSHRSDPRPPAIDTLQAAVLRGGFVITHTTGGVRRVVELDARGAKGRDVALDIPGDVRVVGTSQGAFAGWRQDNKLQLRAIHGNHSSTWGKSAKRLCDGVASNDQRFGIGWLEANNSVWIVSGPMIADAQAQGEELDVANAPLAQVEWCAVASAEKNVALLWRYRDSFRFTTCTAKKCNGQTTSFSFDTKRVVLGTGCLRNACLIASRDPKGSAQLAFVVEAGKVKWTKPVASKAAAISIIGVGSDAFAVGIADGDGARVVTYDRNGREAQVWRDRASSGVPQLAWSNGRLLVAHTHGDAIATEVVDLTR